MYRDVTKKTALLWGMLSGTVARTGPFYVDIDLTRQCNLTCLGCTYQRKELRITQPQDRSIVNFPIDVLKKFCLELKEANTSELILQGAGEPLLHPEISDILRWVKAEGFHITLLTNGTLIDTNMAKVLVESEVDVVKVSLWASNEDQYRKNYPGSNCSNLHKTVNGVAEIASQKQRDGKRHPKLIIFHVINRHNYQTLDKMVDIAIQAGCDGLYFSMMHNYMDGITDSVLGDAEISDVRSTLMDAKKELEKHGLENNVDGVFHRFNTGEHVWKRYPCYIPWIHLRVRVDGMVQPCGRCNDHVNFGNINKQSFADIWNGNTLQEFRRRVSTPEGLAAEVDCDCRFCCFLGDIERVHKIYRWIKPFEWAKS